MLRRVKKDGSNLLMGLRFGVITLAAHEDVGNKKNVKFMSTSVHKVDNHYKYIAIVPLKIGTQM